MFFKSARFADRCLLIQVFNLLTFHVLPDKVGFFCHFALCLLFLHSSINVFFCVLNRYFHVSFYFHFFSYMFFGVIFLVPCLGNIVLLIYHNLVWINVSSLQ